MKKIYLSLSLLCISFLGFAQAEEFKLDFEGPDPLNNLPTGVTHVDGVGDVFVRVDFGEGQEDVTLTQVANTIITDAEDAGNKVLSMDYLGHLIFDEAALGMGSFTIAGKYDGYTNGGKLQWNGFISITGYNPGTETWLNSKLQHQWADGSMNGFNLSTGGVNGFSLLTTGTSNHFVLTFNATDNLIRLYKNGVLKATSSAAQASGDWTNKKLYLGYKGASQSTVDGSFTSPSLDGNSRNKDVEKRVDDITVFKRAISDAEALLLYNNGTLGVNKQAINANFNTYPNPVNDRLYFSTKGSYSVDIYNLLGAKIKSVSHVSASVDMSALKQGVYLVKIMDANGTINKTLKVIKK